MLGNKLRALASMKSASKAQPLSQGRILVESTLLSEDSFLAIGDTWPN